MRRSFVALLTSLVLSTALAGCSGTKTAPQASSDRLPDVTLASLTGGPAVDLGDLRGPAVVNLWAQWCGPCKRELPIYESFYQRHHDQVSVLGVDWQDVQGDLARQMAKKAGLTYPLVVDSEPAVRPKGGLPTLILVEADGKIAYKAGLEIKSLDQLEALVEKYLGVSL